MGAKSAKPRVLLIHWNEKERLDRAERLKSAGYEAVAPEVTPGSLRAILDDPPAAVVIDLSRLPSHGRDVAMALRERKSTRFIPLVFADGAPEKAARFREQLPDALYTTWPRIAHALKRAIANPVTNPVAPSSRLAGYSGTPLPKKLGIKPGGAVAMVNAPDGFEDALGALPEGVDLRRGLSGSPDLILWFMTTRRELEGRIGRILPLMGKQGAWFVWPKKTSGVESDITENVLREVALPLGIVDCKVCAVDATWSGLWFKRRATGRR
jgi:hypothetical protein